MGVDTVEEKRRSEDEDDWWESMMPKLPEPKKNKKKRRRADLEELRNERDKFTEEEMKVLLEEVAKREEALFGDFKEDESPNFRWGLWLEVADKVNDVSIKHRNVEQVRIKWFEHKDPAHKFCIYNKRILYKRGGQLPALRKRYWQLHIRMPPATSSLTSNLHNAPQSVMPPQPILQRASKITLPTISQAQNSCSTSHDDASGFQGEPLRSNQNKDLNDGPSEDVVIIDEIVSKDCNRDYEVIDIDDESTTNEGGEPNTYKENVSGKEMPPSDDTKGSKIAAAENLTWANDGRKYLKMNAKLSEEEKIKEWLELTDEERKARINRILDNLKDIPQNNPRVATPRLKTVEKPRAQHFMISFSQNDGTPSLIPSIENFRNANPSSKVIAKKLSAAPSSAPSSSSTLFSKVIAEKVSVAPSSAPSNSSSSTLSSKVIEEKVSVASSSAPSDSSSSPLLTNPSRNIVSNPSGSSNINSESDNQNPSGSTDANPFESHNTNPSGSSNTYPPGSGNINPTVSLRSNPSENLNTNPSESLNTNPSGSGNTDPSESGNIKSSEGIDTNSSGSNNTDPSESGNIKPSEGIDTNSAVSLSANPSECLNTNPSGSNNTDPSESGNIKPSGGIDTNSSSSVSLSATPSESLNTNPSGSIDANPSESLNTNSSGSSSTDTSGNSITDSSGSSNSYTSESSNIIPSGSNITSPTESSIGRITGVYSMASAEEFQNLPSSNSNGSNNAVLRLVHGKLMSQQPSSKTGLSKVTATVSAPAQKSEDSIPFPSTEPSRLVAISQAPCVKKFQILQPLGTNSSNIMAVVPVNQQMIPQIGLQVSPQVAIEQIFLGKEGETLKNTKNIKESVTRRKEGSHKKTSSARMNSGPELFKEIFGVDATSSSLTSICEQPVVKHIQNHSTPSNTCMERGNTSGRSVELVSKKVEVNLKNILSDNFEADAKKAKNSQKVNLKTVSDGSSHKNTMQSTSAGSTNDGLKQSAERPMKVYSGKRSLQKRVMHSVPDLRENKRKQIFQPSEVIDLTSEGSDDKHNLPNVEGNKTENSKLIEIKDPVSGKSFLILQEKPKNVEIQENKSMVHSPKGDKQSIPSIPASKTKEENKLKQHMKKNFMEKLPLKTIIPKMSPVCVVQGNTIQMPKLQKVQTTNVPILLRKNVSNHMPKPVTLVMLPSEVLASTSGIEKQSGVSLTPIQLSDNQLPVPVAFHKSDNAPLKIIQQPVPVSIHKTNEAPLKIIQQPVPVSIHKTNEAPLKIIQQPVPVSILKANEGPVLTAVASLKNEEEASATDSSKIVVSTNGGRKKLRKDLGKIRPAELLTEDLGELKSDALLNQPVVVLDRLSVKMNDGHCVIRKGNEGKASK